MKWLMNYILFSISFSFVCQSLRTGREFSLNGPYGKNCLEGQNKWIFPSDTTPLFCTSITPTDLQSSKISREGPKVFIQGMYGSTSEEKPALIIDKTKKERFIHPQVIKMFRRAQELIRSGNNTVASKLLIRCLEINPYDSHSWLALARLEERMCNYQRSRELFSQALDKCPDNVHILHAWGLMEERHGSEEIARECWSQAIDIEPYNPYVCHSLASLEKRLRNYDHAKNVLEGVIKFKPTAALCVALSDIQRLQGQPEEAKKTLLYGLRKCRNIHHDRSQVLLALAWLEEDIFNNISDAAKYLEEAIEIDPANVRTYLAKANMELRQHRIDDARRTLSLTRPLHSTDAQHYTMLSSLEYEQGNLEGALEVLKEGAEKFPGDQYLLQRWGSIEVKIGNFQKARELFQKSVQIKPHAPSFVAWAIMEEEEGMRALTLSHSDDTLDLVKAKHKDTASTSNENTNLKNGDILEVLQSVGGASMPRVTPYQVISYMPDPLRPNSERIQYVVAQIAKARELFQMGLLVDPRHGPLYHAYGTMEMRHGNLTGARQIFLQGLARNASDITTVYHGLGQLELKDGNSEKAAEIFRTAIEYGIRGNREIEHGVSFLLHSLGTLELGSSNLQEALKIFTTGIELFPSHSQLQLGLAQTYMKLGKDVEARRYFKASVDSDAKHCHAWQAWAVAEKCLGNVELARALFKQGLKKRPDHGPLWQAYAMMELQQGNLDSARELFAQSVSRAPSHSQSYQAWACLEVRAGNLEKAKMLAMQGLRQSPDHPALYTVAGVVEERLGDLPKARLILESGIKRFPSHGPLFKALGEIESRHDGFKGIIRARELFTKGLERDPSCLQLYHGAALLEAKLGNIEGLSTLHQQARSKYQSMTQTNTGITPSPSHNLELLERISKLEVSAIQRVKGINPPPGTSPSGKHLVSLVRDKGSNMDATDENDVLAAEEMEYLLFQEKYMESTRINNKSSLGGDDDDDDDRFDENGDD